MEKNELLKRLGQMGLDITDPVPMFVCFDCGYEHECRIHGCAVINEAIRVIEGAENNGL